VGNLLGASRLLNAWAELLQANDPPPARAPASRQRSTVPVGHEPHRESASFQCSWHASLASLARLAIRLQNAGQLWVGNLKIKISPAYLLHPLQADTHALEPDSASISLLGGIFAHIGTVKRGLHPARHFRIQHHTKDTPPQGISHTGQTSWTKRISIPGRNTRRRAKFATAQLQYIE
jgi:hypothetical protein